jgi:hypothetical protein
MSRVNEPMPAKKWRPTMANVAARCSSAAMIHHPVEKRVGARQETLWRCSRETASDA